MTSTGHIARDGACFCVRRFGEGGGPVVLLHSLFFDGRMFDAIIPYLGGRLTIIPDHRGQGESDAGRLAPTAEQLAADTWDLVGGLTTEPVHLVGSSMGGYVAMEMLVEHPDRVHSLALSCCTCDPESDPGRFAALADRIAASGGRGLGDVISALMFGDKFRADPANAPPATAWRNRFDALPPGTDRVVRAIFAHRGWRNVLRDWTGPILAISGDADRAKSPAHLAWIADVRRQMIWNTRA